MVEILSVLIVVLLALAVGFLIPLLIEMRKTSIEARQFMQDTRELLKTTLSETDETLRSIRKISEDINGMTGDVRFFSSAVSDTAGDIRSLGAQIRELTEKTSSALSGVRVGVKTAIEIIISNFLKRGGSK